MYMYIWCLSVPLHSLVPTDVLCWELGAAAPSPARVAVTLTLSLLGALWCRGGGGVHVQRAHCA